MRSSLPWLALASISSAAIVVAAPQEEAMDRIPFTVSSVEGPLLRIDVGAREGLRKGDQVVVRRDVGPPWVGAVRRVDATTARVELDATGASDAPIPGAQGEVLVPRDREPGTEAQEVPEHPPWKEPVDTWAPGKPLLAPATSPEPEERPSEVHGRVSLAAQSTNNAQYDTETQRVRADLDVDWENPFARGGLLRFQGDVSLRERDSDVGFAEEETILRLSRFSYRVGGRVGEPHRVEVGRFLSELFPQFGLLDGVEYVRRLEGGDQFGGSLGFLPDYQDDLAASDDLSAAAFYRWVDSPRERLALGLGLQKTWHGGEADRDLLVGTATWIANEDTDVRASVLVDHYDSRDTLKSEGFELTELHASLNRRLGNSAGVSLFLSHMAWPELLENDFPLPAIETIEAQAVDRAGVSGWVELGEKTRLYARLDGWRDEDDSGHYADLRLDRRDLFSEDSEISLGAFETTGSFNDGVGLRLRYTQWIGVATLRASYEAARYTQAGFLGEQENLLQHRLSLGLDTRLTEEVDWSVGAEQFFGDEQDALSLATRLTWRF